MKIYQLERSGLYTIFSLSLFTIVLMSLLSCNKVEVEAPNYQLDSSNIFQDPTTAEAAVLGIYSAMAETTGFASGGQQSIVELTGLSADEFLNHSQVTEQGQFYANQILATNSWNELYLWNEGYKYIYQANAILEGLENSSELSPELKERLKGEVIFLRAFCYFYLVNLYGELPIATGTDYRINQSLERKPIGEVYDFIINDLELAQEVLPVNYGSYGGERTRATKWAATSLLARVYLYTENWNKAETAATQVLNQTDLYNILNDLNQVFLANSTEAIWQLQPVIPNINTREGNGFILVSVPFNVSLRPSLIDKFEIEDLRRSNWIDSLSIPPDNYYYPSKYKIKSGTPVTEYSMLIRFAEIHLIRAEARIHLGNFIGAEEDLNIIRSRANLESVVLSSNNQGLEIVIQERFRELFTEGGHRWLDLKRKGRAGDVLSPIKENWQETDVRYPIPENELNRNMNLVQNPGY